MTEQVMEFVKGSKKGDGLFDRIAMRRTAKPEEIANFLYSLSKKISPILRVKHLISTVATCSERQVNAGFSQR